ncbi:hypothetical protein DMH01_23330 [Amycolatopsis sp. WAC 04182]|uniref:WXG100 family type VII secretion target n=1 Tax=Amycolatopsis sp. WAC 04182 TaxID=2203198 RepID=UPI000F770E96|nr:WXG100 family type VII secretion target [Amycolatopsis sp. WAC 04182]RSN58933.1 hypothetical protein DMH01_23330 [Amycolatopsis sp. WAC 04182]
MPNGGGGAGFTADPDAVKSAAAKLGIAADQLDEAGKELVAAMNSLGQCWGNDDAGKEFAKDYEPGAQGSSEGFANIVEALRGMQHNVERSMTAYTNAEEEIKSTLDKKV